MDDFSLGDVRSCVQSSLPWLSLTSLRLTNDKFDQQSENDH